MAERRRGGYLSTLSGRILAMTIGVSLIAVLVTAGVSLQVVQTVALGQARDQLRSQTAALADLSSDSLADVAAAKEKTDGQRFAVVDADGTVSGNASAFVGRRILAALDAGRTLSRTVRIGGQEAIVEAVPRTDGGGVVGIRRVDDIRAGSAVFLRWTLVALAIGFAAAIIAGLILSRRIGRPLAHLAGSARRMAAGERGVVIEHQSIPEVDDIGRALAGLDTALIGSESRQREFLLSVSHELRTPLTAIRGYAEALADGMVPADQLDAVGRTLSAESQRLGRFVDDLLELARMEADDFAISVQEVDAHAIVATAGQAWSARCAQLGIELRVESPPDPLLFRSDAMRVRQVLDGLIENAVRITPSGAPLVIAARAGASDLVFEVRDGGPGLTADDLAVAFDRGALHERYRHERAVGTGLGLSIARRLVGRLGGRIEALPAPEGGACFRVLLPIT